MPYKDYTTKLLDMEHMKMPETENFPVPSCDSTLLIIAINTDTDPHDQDDWLNARPKLP